MRMLSKCKQRPFTIYSTMNFLRKFTAPHSKCLRLEIRSLSTTCRKEKRFTKTLLLPYTKYVAHISHKKRLNWDEELMDECEFYSLYNWQRKNLSGPDFILHDGPPYANGLPHMGHAINKILKDFTLRSKVIRGQRVHYVPGWDCHGLPIENKVLNSIKDNHKLTPSEIRQKARELAKETMCQQRQHFKSWGVMADWSDAGCYSTNTPSYIQNELRQFMNLYEKNFVFRDFKAVHWSPYLRTALAEAELVYDNNHVSKAATIRLKMDFLPLSLKQFESKTLYALTWTTTPWTLVSNQAIAFSPSISYCIAEDQHGVLYILAEDLLHNVEKGIGPLKPVLTFMGESLTGARYQHPITKESLPFLSGSHVNTAMGTGLVHTAPAHGQDDFNLALKNKIPILSLVDADGKYTKEAGNDFCGMDVLIDGNETVLQRIGCDNLYVEDFKHSYPYDWRVNKPVILRASHQWFIDIDAIKQKITDDIENIEIYPEQNRESFKNGLLSHIMRRPYWCISRQRFWGTPIPVFYHKDTDKPFINRKLVERLCNLIDKEGPDCWWNLSTDQLVGSDLLNEYNIESEHLKKGEDIMDVWFDSGISWSTVLEGKKADLYLEGLDQFSGWFQASLLTSVALQGCAPFRSLFVHGFAVDNKERKMSKSEGNIINPDDIIKGYKITKETANGIDVFRWWIAAHGCQHSKVPVSEALFAESFQAIRKIRLMVHYLLGASCKHNSKNTEPKYNLLDRYMLHQLYCYNKEIQQLYDNYAFYQICMKTRHFIVNNISDYCNSVKDRLYCEQAISPYRVAVVDVLTQTLTVLIRCIAPIVPHLAEEIWLFHPENIASLTLFKTQYRVPETWEQIKVLEPINTALKIRSIMNKSVSADSWKAAVTINATESDYNVLSELQDEEISQTSELCEVLHAISVKLVKDASLPETQVDVSIIEGESCKRCKRYLVMPDGSLCERCYHMVGHIIQARASS